jgi:AcrR family transcriptional regulator
MSIVIAHDKRKGEILEKALDIFLEEGFDNVTYQKIADRCGITRTTLYIYFHDKREIFQASIRQLTLAIEGRLKEIVADESLGSMEKLRRTLYDIIDTCVAHRKLFAVLLPYLQGLQKAGKDINERVRRRVLRVRHILSAIVIEGQNRGEIRPIKVHEVNEMLYALIEAAIFRLSVLCQSSLSEMHAVIDAALSCLGET